MTLTTTASEITYTGDGVTQLFPVPFYWLADADLKVYQTPAATGVVTLLTLTTNYTVSGSGNPAGGSVSMVAAPAAGDRLVIFRDPPATPLTDLQSNDAFPANTVETTFDKLTMLSQRLSARLGRTIRLQDGVPSVNLQLPAAVANNLLSWNPTATGLVNVDPLTVGPGAAASVSYVQLGTGAVIRSVQDRLRETFSVRDFGADPTGVADSSAAITNAIVAASAVNGVVVFPSGTYTAQLVPLLSYVKLQGVGGMRPVIQMPQVNVVGGPRSIFITTGTITDVVFENLTLQGNAGVQTTTVSYNAYAIEITNDATRISILSCRFTNLGTRVSTTENGGAVIFNLIGAASNLGFDQIRVLNSIFETNWNVPGVFLGLDSTGRTSRNIIISGNSFSGGGLQNCVYLAGGQGANDFFEGVAILGNTFPITRECDTCIECNGVRNVSITGNTIRLVAPAQGILLRRNVRDVAINNNTIDATGVPARAAYALAAPSGISLIRFSAGQTQQYVTVVGNTLLNLPLYGVQIDAGTSRATVSANVIASSGTAMTAGVYVADAQETVIDRNTIVNATNAVAIAATAAMAGLYIKRNLFDTCGSNGGAIIQSVTANIPLTRFVVDDNDIINPVATTTNAVSLQLAAAGGIVRRMNKNGCTNLVNPSYVANFTSYDFAATAALNVTGSKAANAALASLLTQLAALGLITDSTT